LPVELVRLELRSASRVNCMVNANHCIPKIPSPLSQICEILLSASKPVF
jgi:hypothetical protein